MYFPHTILDFQRQFSTERACWEYLAAVRWPDDGAVCPRCGRSSKYFVETRDIWQCPKRHQFSITSGTVMQRSHVPLQKWFWAAYLVTTQTPGISAMVLQRQIGVCYETAYMMLQRLRAGMVEPHRMPLKGRIEADDAYVNVPRTSKSKRGRGTGKTPIVAAIEIRNGYATEIRLRRLNAVSANQLEPFFEKHVQQGSTIITDGWRGYSRLARIGYMHKVVRGETPEEVGRKLPRVHKAFANLKAWLIGTHHGVSSKHLQAYLNEFAFRYNWRQNPQEGFLAVLQIGTHKKGPSYRRLYQTGERNGWEHPNPLRAK